MLRKRTRGFFLIINYEKTSKQERNRQHKKEGAGRC